MHATPFLLQLEHGVSLLHLTFLRRHVMQDRRLPLGPLDWVSKDRGCGKRLLGLKPGLRERSGFEGSDAILIPRLPGRVDDCNCRLLLKSEEAVDKDQH
jgi:hypothetical protein